MTSPLSPPDLPKWSCVSREGQLLHRGECFATTPEIQYAEVSPSGRYLAVQLAPTAVFSPAAANTLSVYTAFDFRPVWQKAVTGQLRAGHFGESFSFNTGEYCLAETGAAIACPHRTVGVTWVLTAPHSSAMAGFIVTVGALRTWPFCSRMVMMGYLPGSEHNPDATPLWTREIMRVQLPKICGDCVVLLHQKHAVLHDLQTGEALKRFSCRNTMRVCILSRTRCASIDTVDRRVRDLDTDAWHNGGHSVVRSVVPLGRPETAVLIQDHQVLLADQRTGALMESWAWNLGDCAAFEHVQTLRAIEATDELPQPETVGLVRAVLAGFVAEDARVTQLRLL